MDFNATGDNIPKKTCKGLGQLNTALPGLLLGIVLFGVLCQIVGIFFVADKAGYSIGLWIGVVTACFMAFHMAWSLDRAVEKDVKGAQATVTRHNIIRYLAVVVILGILMVTRLGNPLSAFLGIIGLKASAYMQPLFEKMSRKKLNRETK